MKTYRLWQFGQRVRVMQTPEMEHAGLTNMLGTVMGNQKTPSHLVSVAMDDPDESNVTVPGSCLMAVGRG